MRATTRETANLTQFVDVLLDRRYDDIEVPDGPWSHDLNRLVQGLRHQATIDLDTMISFSVELVEQAILSATMFRDVRGIDEVSQSLAAQSAELNATTETMQNTAAAAEEAGAETKTAAADGQHAADTTMTAMGRLIEVIRATSERSTSLAEATASIETIVGQIRSIAEQTNLLALNASIEAARAGQAGRGFAVVASEVKSLAERSAKATADVDAMITSLRSTTDEIGVSMSEATEAMNEGQTSIEQNVAAMDRIVHSAEETAVHTQVMAAGLQDQMTAVEAVTQSSQEIADGSAANLRAIEAGVDSAGRLEHHVIEAVNGMLEAHIHRKTVRVAKLDHMVWRRRLAAMLLGRESLNPSELSDHTSCRLGRWYTGEGRSLNDLEDFRSLEEPHRQVHAHGIEAARRFADGDVEGALKEVDEVAKWSRDVMDLLSALSSPAPD